MVRRLTCMTGAAVACTIMLMSVAAAQSRRVEPASAGRPDENVLVSLPATAPWSDTGLDVRRGDRLSVRAWGRVTYGSDATKPMTPAGGGKGGGCRFALVDSAVPADIVIANIAPAITFDGRGFVVGSSRDVTVPVSGSTAEEGRLFIGINHQGIMCDRSGYDSWEFRNNGGGAFTVEIAVRRKK